MPPSELGEKQAKQPIGTKVCVTYFKIIFLFTSSLLFYQLLTIDNEPLALTFSFESSETAAYKSTNS